MTKRRIERRTRWGSALCTLLVALGLFFALALSGCQQAPNQADTDSAVDPPTEPAATPVADGASGPAASTAEPAQAELSWSDVPVSMKPCFTCHRDAVASYLGHGMSRSIGPVGEIEIGGIDNPASGNRYEMRLDGGEPWLHASFSDGGVRGQRLVGRIGAGVLDTSWVGEEVDLQTGEPTGRLFFAPIETITGHGPELSPFDLSSQNIGLDMALTEGCLTCHTTDRMQGLPGAARPQTGTGDGEVFPANALGSDAFEQLSPLTCDACHGDSARHLELMTTPGERPPDDIGLRRLADQSAGAQRDVCARCHLQGDARFDLVAAQPDRAQPLAGQIPMLVPSTQTNDFRFVSQIERLVLSPCFQGVPDMTCTTCHQPHSAVAAQGTASFDAVCSSCHEMCSRSPELTVAEVTGEPARSEAGCVDCHVRRSQPIDLPHVRSVDHNIRRRIPKPEELPFRQFADPEGPLEVFDDGRLAPLFASSAGKKWRDGVEAMGLITMGRIAEAGERFASFPEPGSAAATQPSAPRGLVAVETYPAFHQMRALSLLATGNTEAAIAAYSDALKLDPLQPSALMGRAQLRLDTGDIRGVMADTQAVIDAYPKAEQPWQLRATLAERIGRPALAASAFEAYVLNWPSNPTVWTKLGLLRRQAGNEQGAQEALNRARQLSPSFRLQGATVD